MGNRLPTLTAARVALRSLTEDDVPDLFDVFSDPEVMRYWDSPPLKSIAEASALFGEIREGFETKGLFQWGISDRTSACAGAARGEGVPASDRARRGGGAPPCKQCRVCCSRGDRRGGSEAASRRRRASPAPRWIPHVPQNPARAGSHVKSVRQLLEQECR